MLSHVNPESLHKNPAFSQGVLIEGPGDLLVVGGQNGVDESGAIVGDDIGSQAARALTNLKAVLDSAGATVEDVAKLTIYMVAPADIDAAFAASREVWGTHPTAVTVVQVAGLGNPEWLIEIEALARVTRWAKP